MKTSLIPALSVVCIFSLSHAQEEAPVSSGTPSTAVVVEKQTVVSPSTETTTAVVVPTEQPSNVVVQTRAVSDETLAVLRDIRRIAPEREGEVQSALKVQSDAEANLILDNILADAKDDVRKAQAARLELDVVNRTAQERADYVDYMSRRLQGQVAVTEAPASFRSRVVTAPATTTETIVVPATPETVAPRQPRYYGPGRRVITYRTREEIPPVLLASGQLKRVEITEVAGSPFRNDLVLVDDMPAAYIEPDAYAVSYVVNPNTEITRNDILFQQGTTDFADAYSYDVVVDLAMAMKSPALSGQAFIIEGHASAEGDYSSNLSLSQARAERIARELARFGVSHSHLVPVGYGESESTYPADAPEELRRQDRRVTVFSLQNP